MDAEKAFDRIEWSFLWAVLDHVGAGQGFIQMVKTLYNCCSARVLIGSLASSSFALGRGTRQGCPLSPLLFTLSVEPLAQAVWQTVSIQPIICVNTSQKNSLYADDILLFVSNISVSVPECLNLFNIFGSLSGYKINWNKSALMPLNEAARQESNSLPPLIPIVKQFTYLGITISPSIHLISNCNYISLLNKIKEDLDRWSPLCLALHGRISTIKMNVLPRVNFLFSMLPLPPPEHFFKELNMAISRFIWLKKKPRIRLKTMQRKKLDGGLSLPNFELYNLAFQIRGIRTWVNSDSSVPWRVLEANIIHPVRLQDLPFSGISKSLKKTYGPIIEYLLDVWKKVEKITGGPFLYTKTTPLWHNNRLCTGNKPFVFKTWSDSGVHTLNDIYCDDSLKSFRDLSAEFSLPGFSFFLYLRLRSALKAYGVPWATNVLTHPLWEWLNIDTPSSGLVSKIYNSILVLQYTYIPAIYSWERDGLVQTDWDVVWARCFTASKNLAHQMIHYKCINRAYFTPSVLYKMKVRSDPYCHLCNKSTIGSYLHMFWECPVVVPFWESVCSILSDYMQLDIPRDPLLLLLLDDSSLQLNVHQKRTLLAASTAAKKTILKLWIEPSTPITFTWLSYFRDIVLLEGTTARLNGAKDNTIQSWTKVAEMLLDRLKS